MPTDPEFEPEQAGFPVTVRLMWVPASVDEELAPQLDFGVPIGEGAVGELLRMSREDYLDRLEGLLAEIIADDPESARNAMEMSAEHLPEPYSIAQFHSQRYWAIQLRWSDALSAALNGFDFDKPGLVQEFDTRGLANILEQF